MSSAPLSFPAVFLAGLVASLSPCVYPLIPITLGFLGTQAPGGSALRPVGKIFGYFLGQVLAFVGLGVFAVLAGETLGFTSESPTVNLAMAILLIGAGTWSFYGRLPEFIARRIHRRASAAPRAPAYGWGGLLGAVLLGAGSALVASPCTSPILAGVLTTMSTSASLVYGIALMVFYAAGFSALFLALGLGLFRLPRSGVWMIYFHRLSAIVLLGTGGFYLVRALR